MENTEYCSIDNIEKLAKENNRIKLDGISSARIILKEYEEEFIKSCLYSENLQKINLVKERIINEAAEKDIETAVGHFFYNLRENATAEEFYAIINTVKRSVENAYTTKKAKDK